MTTTACWLGCASGVAGDMVLGALLDAGADLEGLRGLLAGLELSGWSLRTEKVSRSGIEATRAIVEVSDDASVRSWSTIRSLVESAQLPERVVERSLATFAGLAEVEARRHGVPVEEVHFHELGGHDALIDVVGVAGALELLGVDELSCSPVGLGHGIVTSAHGELPAPAPATVELLEGFAVHGIDLAFETATPTGAALLRALCQSSSPIPAMTLSSQGFGAGSRELPGRANVVTALIGCREERSDEQVAWLSTNLDDITGEHLAHAIEALLDDGALDVWTEPITMKKGRPAHSLNLLCAPERAIELQDLVSARTGSLGVRAVLIGRSSLARRTETVEVLGQRIRLKVTAVGTKPEFDDVAAAAGATGRSLAEIDALARAALRS